MKIVSLEEMRKMGFKDPEIGEFTLKYHLWSSISGGEWSKTESPEMEIEVVDDDYLYEHGCGD